MLTEEQHRFIGEVLHRAVELEKNLPQVFMRLPLVDFIGQNDQLWDNIRSKIIDRYPQYIELLSRKDLAFRVVYRPRNNNTTLPGFDDNNHNTRTLSFRYGMDYKPEDGEYIGMTRETPWANYMLPDPRYADPKQYHTMMYIYDNEGNQLVREGQTTAGPIPKDNYLTDFLKMIVDIGWVDIEPDNQLDPLVHDSTLEDLRSLAIRAGWLKE